MEYVILGLWTLIVSISLTYNWFELLEGISYMTLILCGMFGFGEIMINLEYYLEELNHDKEPIYNPKKIFKRT